MVLWFVVFINSLCNLFKKFGLFECVFVWICIEFLKCIYDVYIGNNMRFVKIIIVIFKFVVMVSLWIILILMVSKVKKLIVFDSSVILFGIKSVLKFVW